MNIRDRLAHGFFYIFSGRVGAGLLTVLITPIIVRILGNSGYGDYAFALAVYSVLRTVAGGGVYEGARKYIAEKATGSEKEAVFYYYLKISVTFGTITASLLIVVTYLAVGQLIFEPRFRTYLYIVSGMVFFHAFYHLVRSSLMGYNLEEYSEPLYILNRVFFPLIGIPLAVVGLHVTGILIGHLLSTLLIVLIGYAALLRYTSVSLGSPTQLLPTPRIFRSRMFRYGLLNIVFVLITKSLYVTDILLLQTFVPSEEVGYYNAALVAAEFLWFVPMTLQIVLLHSASQLWAEDRMSDITEMASTISRYTLLMTGTIAVVLVVIGDLFLSVYFGSEFTISYLPMLLLLPGVVGFAMARPIYAISQGHGDMRILVVATGGAAVINLLGNLILIPQYGMYGAAVATSIGYGSMVTFHVFTARNLGFFPLHEVPLLRIALTCLFPLPVLLFLYDLLASTILLLLVVPAVALPMFIVLARAFNVISKQELDECKQIVRRRVGSGFSYR